MIDMERKKRSDVGKKRDKYVWKIPRDYASVNRWCNASGVTNNLSHEEVEHFMNEKCVLCGGRSYVIVPFGRTEKVLHAMNASVLCMHCYPAAHKMGIERFALHAFRISDHARNFISTNDRQVQG